jgi:hypothetical protein
MRKETTLVLQILCWVALFSQLSFVLVQYENIMNASVSPTIEQALFTGAKTNLSLNCVDLFHEGVVGYGLMVAMGAAVFMFGYDVFKLQRNLQSLAQSERALDNNIFTAIGGENVV